MRLFGKDLDSDPVVIAEIGVNHEGDLETAKSLIRLAARSGADAVKFQSYTPERYVSRSQADRFARIDAFALSEDDHLRLKEEATASGVSFFSTPLTEDWVEFLAVTCDALKVASGDLTFEPTVRAVAETDLPVLVSTGMATWSEIDRSIAWIEQQSARPLRDRLALLHCVSAYPAPTSELNLRAIPAMRERYGVTIGYSNHSLELAVCYAAVSLGARVVEVHFTDSREGKTFHDHLLSVEPAELERLVERVSAIAQALGSDAKSIQPSEMGNLENARKGIVAALDISAGTVIQESHLMFARPASEFSADEMKDLLGREIKRSLRRGELIERDDLV